MGAMEYIRKSYKVPAQRGGRIRFEGRKTGTIVAARNALLRVRFDGQRNIASLHPTWKVEYLQSNRSDGTDETL